MTNNIEKLYELAKVEKIQYSGVILGDYPMRFHDVGYPPFTAEKQLNLIKWLILNPFIDEISLCYNEPSKTYNIEIYNIPECGNFRDSRIEFNSEFEHTLAGLVCELWEELSDEQREEIKEILK